LLALAIWLVYPLFYDGKQLFKTGFAEYLSSFWNFVDILHILGGYANLVLQYFYEDIKRMVPQSVLVVIILSTLFKLFFFMRLNKRFSVITTMIFTCIYDLRFFLTFFIMLLVFFGSMLNVLSPNP